MIATGSFRALGTTAVVAVTRPELLETARRILAAELNRVDQACSRFRPDSELSAVNRQQGSVVHVSPALADAVRVALDAAETTNGLVDPTLGGDLCHLGYDRTFALVQERAGWHVEERVRSRPTWREVELDAERRALRLPPGLELDLGATAKAHAADVAAARIAHATGAGTLVSLGGDVAVCGVAPRQGWCVLISEAHDAPLGGDGQRVSLTTGGLATSSTSVRRWVTERGEMHHILDPRTGLPARSLWRSVSVAAATCVDANVASTAAIVMGASAPEWLERRGLPARLVASDGCISTAGGWPSEEDERCSC